MIPPSPSSLDVAAAAALVGLDPRSIGALAAAGYVATETTAEGEKRFNLSDLKAFVARNADNGSGAGWEPGALEAILEPQELVDRLDQRTEHMALRLLKMYATIFPPAETWPIERQSRFVVQTKARFDAIMAVALGGEFEADFLQDLRVIGAGAARAAVELPDMLMLLRISRDMVVQNAIEIAGEGARRGALALALLVTRILAAMDRLSDALAAGYWEEMWPAS